MNVSKYNTTVAWSTLAENVKQITRETVDDPATYQIKVKSIDSNELGSGEVDITMYFTDFLGNPYSITNVNSNIITLSDDFRVGCPTSGHIGYIHKSAYKGYSLYLPSFCFRKLHPIAQQNNLKYQTAILWGNDPNPRRIEFTSILQPQITDYTADLVDMDNITFNPEEDYGQNPKFEIWQNMGDNKYSRLYTDPQIIRDIDGNISSVLFSGTGEEISGYIIISR